MNHNLKAILILASLVKDGLGLLLIGSAVAMATTPLVLLPLAQSYAALALIFLEFLGAFARMVTAGAGVALLAIPSMKTEKGRLAADRKKAERKQRREEKRFSRESRRLALKHAYHDIQTVFV